MSPDFDRNISAYFIHLFMLHSIRFILTLKYLAQQQTLRLNGTFEEG